MEETRLRVIELERRIDEASQELSLVATERRVLRMREVALNRRLEMARRELESLLLGTT